jgi:hypothetical protein
LDDGMRALNNATLIAGARLDCLVRPRLESLSGRTMLGVGLLTASIAALAYLRGADVRAALAGSQPGLLPHALPGLQPGPRASGGGPPAQPGP